MPLFCTLRPNRTKKRHYTANDAARVCCYAVRNGATKIEIDKRFDATCREKPEERRKLAAEAAMEAAIIAVENNDAVLADAYKLFNTINGLLGVLFTALPILRLPSLVIRLLSRSANLPTGLIPAMTQNILAQRAANQNMLLILRQSAANEARFRLTGTR